MPDAVDTIAALATPIGGTIAILRTSGPRAIEWKQALGVTHEYPHPCLLQLGPDLPVPATVLVFRAPRSATGEDVVEYHFPGSPWIASRLLERLYALGARQAEPGEFTSRAFLNGKLDLAAAEGVVATISASNRAGLDAGRRLLSGELSRRLAPMMERLAEVLALVEVGIDFSEEDVSFIDRDRLLAAIESSCRELDALLAAAPSLERLEHEPRIVLAGRPNAGKSSLLNALAGRLRAVVADVAGTTRDVLSERVALDTGYITLTDAAGLGGGVPTDAIEVQMREKSLRAIEEADRVVLVIATDDDRAPLNLLRSPDLVVYSKSDLASAEHAGVSSSVMKAGGLDALRTALDTLAFPADRHEAEQGVALNVRHRSLVAAAIESLRRAADSLPRGPELVAAELRAAIDALGGILGKVAPDDVLGRIFSSFCIGK